MEKFKIIGIPVVTVAMLAGIVYLVMSNMKAEKKLKALNEAVNDDKDAETV